MRDINKRLVSSVAIAPAANRTASVNGLSHDLANYDSFLGMVHFGVITDGGWTPKFQDSPDDSVWTDDAAANQVGTFSEALAASDLITQQASYIGAQRYVRIVVTESTSSSTGALFSAEGILGNNRKP